MATTRLGLRVAMDCPSSRTWAKSSARPCAQGGGEREPKERPKGNIWQRAAMGAQELRTVA
eukprot:12002673-Alexandrium_andersonii.AAC.1